MKPSNILLFPDSIYKIADFGHSDYHPINPGSEPEGDRTYLAPEIFHSVYDFSADIFSLGLVLLEILTDIILPENGPEWHQLRTGDLTGVEFKCIPPLVVLVSRMLSPDLKCRPGCADILGDPLVGVHHS